ncbi:hypothetical protein QR680_005696 [Steinernema hermaphroditum]|uniref:Uncharacterized protein n=1 Tax=Steinernema hermaphroditum TaxID=289476 RepID=A0AA39LW68_9BILA|nr:hypothetical protein QR680_005696 [Steinernema hermaphroditum]
MTEVPSEHRILVGVIYSVSSLAALPLYVYITWLLLSQPKYRRLICYVVIAQIGLLECALLVGEVVLGLVVACDLREWKNLNYTVSAFTNTGWNGLFPTILVLAVNRLDVICALKVFTKRIFDYALLALCWLYALLFLILCLTPMARIHLSFTYLMLDYDLETAPFSAPLQRLEYVSSFIFLGLTLAVYGAIVLLLMRKRRSLTADHQLVAPMELRLMLQGSLTFCCSAVIVLLWHMAPYFNARYYWFTSSVNLMIIVNCGYLNPLLLLLMNREVRGDVLRPFRSSKVLFTLKTAGFVESPGASL